VQLAQQRQEATAAVRLHIICTSSSVHNSGAGAVTGTEDSNLRLAFRTAATAAQSYWPACTSEAIIPPTNILLQTMLSAA
jgi:hypothetical protein